LSNYHYHPVYSKQKIILDAVDQNLFFKFSHYHSTRQHDYILYPPKPLKKIGHLSFVSRVAGPWNGLPLGVVEADSVRIF